VALIFLPVYSENSPILAAKSNSGIIYIKLKIKWRTGLKMPYNLKLKSFSDKNFAIKKRLQNFGSVRKIFFS